MRRWCLAAMVFVLLASGCSTPRRAAPGSAGAPRCATASRPPEVATASQLRTMNELVGRLGARPTGSRAHRTYIEWIERNLRSIEGLSVAEQAFTINRWVPSAASLGMQVDGSWQNLAVAAPIAYAKPTDPQGVTAPFAAVPDGQPITAANASGKIVVRHAPAGSVPQSVFFLPIVSWSVHDRKHTIDRAGTFYGDFLNYKARLADLADAAAAHAAGIVFVKDLPLSQLAGHYEPYEGVQSATPGVWLGVDEGKRITDALAAGKRPVGRLVLPARFVETQTPTVVATLPGRSAQRLVVESHTDGTNAVEDNGPVAMIAMARSLAPMPQRCRPRTIQFVFSTAHFYQRLVSPSVRNGGAEADAEALDSAYDHGTVSAVVTLEHLGAIDYEAGPRSSPGKPGQELRATGQRAMQQIFVTPSRDLVQLVEKTVDRYGLDRTVVMKGADVPGETVPAHCDFGGEGTPYNKHLLPTVGVISAPQTLYDPAFGVEGIDFDVMRDETVAYTSLVMAMSAMPQPAVAGSVTTERAQRAQGAPGCKP